MAFWCRVDGHKPYAAYVNSGPLDADSLAARLRLLRTQLGLSQEQLARRLSVSFATVNRWESGRSRPSARTSLAIAELEAAVGSQRPPRDDEPARRRESRQGQEPAPGREPAAERTDRLPVARSSFIGRERELAELSGLLARSRLITLIGPGGAGKTRLAVEAVRRWTAADEAVQGGDVVFVPLEAIRPPQSEIGRASCRERVYSGV